MLLSVVQTLLLGYIVKLNICLEQKQFVFHWVHTTYMEKGWWQDLAFLHRYVLFYWVIKLPLLSWSKVGFLLKGCLGKIRHWLGFWFSCVPLSAEGWFLPHNFYLYINCTVFLLINQLGQVLWFVFWLRDKCAWKRNSCSK